jgi:hypothetical protein
VRVDTKRVQEHKKMGMAVLGKGEKCLTTVTTAKEIDRGQGAHDASATGTWSIDAHTISANTRE